MVQHKMKANPTVSHTNHYRILENNAESHWSAFKLLSIFFRFQCHIIQNKIRQNHTTGIPSLGNKRNLQFKFDWEYNMYGDIVSR